MTGVENLVKAESRGRARLAQQRADDVGQLLQRCAADAAQIHARVSMPLLVANEAVLRDAVEVEESFGRDYVVAMAQHDLLLGACRGSVGVDPGRIDPQWAAFVRSIKTAAQPPSARSLPANLKANPRTNIRCRSPAAPMMTPPRAAHAAVPVTNSKSSTGAGVSSRHVAATAGRSSAARVAPQGSSAVVPKTPRDFAIATPAAAAATASSRPDQSCSDHDDSSRDSSAGDSTMHRHHGEVSPQRQSVATGASRHDAARITAHGTSTGHGTKAIVDAHLQRAAALAKRSRRALSTKVLRTGKQ